MSEPISFAAELEVKQDDVVHIEGKVPDSAVPDRAELYSEWQNLSVWQTVRAFRWAIVFCFLAAFSAAADGYQIGINGNIIANKGFVQQFGTIHEADGSVAIRAPILSAWNACINIGQMFAMLAFTPLSERYGRKFTFYLMWVILAASVTLESVAKVWQVWLVAKLLAGCGVGTLQFSIPCYIAEIAPINVRGSMIFLYNIWWSSGSLFASVALQVLNTSQPYNYKLPIYTQWGQIGLMLIIYLYLPESPLWCAARGHTTRGQNALRRINGNIPGYDVAAQYEVMEKTVLVERELAEENKRTRWWAIYKGVDGWRTLLCAIPVLSQGFLGLSLFGSYSSYFFETAGLTNPFTGSVVQSAVQLAATIIYVFVAERVGRRYIFCLGTDAMWLATLLTGILGSINDQAKSSSIVLVLFSCIWSIGLVASGSCGQAYMGEIPSMRYRTMTAGAGYAWQDPISIALGYAVPYMLSSEYLGWGIKTAFFYTGVGAPFAIGVWFLMPEVKGRSPGELDELFERKVKPWRFHKTETEIQRAARESNLMRN